MTAPVEPAWAARYRAGRPRLPRYATARPHRCVVLTRGTGLPQLVAWDQDTGARHAVAPAPVRYAIDWAGEFVWWFADSGGRGVGSWWRKPFQGGTAVAMTPADLAPAGLAFSQDSFAVGAFDTRSTQVWYGDTWWTLDGDRSVVAATPDGRLLALSEVGPDGPRRAAVVAIDTRDGKEVARLAGFGGRRVHPIGFSPHRDDSRLLLLHEARGPARPLLWDPVTGAVDEPDLPLAGELRAEWMPDGASLLLCELAGGRSRLLSHRLGTAGVTEIPTGSGFVHDATGRPDGSVEYLRSSTGEPAEVRSTTGVVLARSAAEPAKATVTHCRVDGPGGAVPVLVCQPVGVTGPPPAVVVLHGGPAMHDTDSFNPYVAAWLDHGCCVIRVNYRGSTGFGREWREPAGYRPGLTELEDVDAVRGWAVRAGLADPTRVVVAGSSWGGYLALLAAGRSPRSWSLCIAEAPVTDFAAAYETETQRLRALDRSLFGGSPAQCPDGYRESSPITYVDRVVVPVLLTVGANDPRCPAQPVREYARRLAARGIEVVLDEHPSGHGSRDVDERVRQVRRQLAFAAGRLRIRLDGPAERGGEAGS